MMARQMKDSGIEWIGQIPTSWKIRKGKWLFSRLERHVKDDDGVITCFRDGEVTLRSNRREDGFTVSFQEIGYQGIEPGDLVVHGMDGFAGAIGISDSRGKGTPVLTVLDSIQNKTYYMFYLRNLAYNGIFLALSTGIRVRSCDTNWNKLKELPYLVPPLEEQNRIADFITQQCFEIDAIIAKTKATIEEYKKLKQSIITEAVTKGIRGDRTMKNSGIEWIGEIPTDWDCIKTKYLFQTGDGALKIGPFGSALSGKTLSEGPYKIYNQAHLVSNDFSLSRHFVAKNTFDELKSYEVKPGDILFSMMGTIGKCRIMPDGHSEGIMDSHLLKARLNHMMDTEFFTYVYDKDNSSIGIGQLNHYSNGSIMSGLNSTIVKNIHIPLPPINEQKEIVFYLNRKCGEIDTLIAKKTALLEEMESYKKSVIYEYVTGKKEVP